MLPALNVAAQTAGWKRTRAWSASQATRSGPSIGGRAQSMLGRRRGRHHRHPVGDHLAPGDLGAVNGSSR